jgi:hypothetical protein
VFWCADKGFFALLVLFKKIPTLVFNGNVKSDILLYLSFPSFYLNF